jgi:hypothetical protein
MHADESASPTGLSPSGSSPSVSPAGAASIPFAGTPGPWVVGNTDPLLFGRRQGSGSEPIGCVYGPALPERSELGQRALADARLIAAAPDLLFLLREAARELPLAAACWNDDENEATRATHVPRVLGLIERINAAIARATGA